MPDYKSPNGFGQSEQDANDVSEPTAEQIDQWNNPDYDPSAVKAGEDQNQDKEVKPEPPPQEEKQEEPVKEEPQKKSPYQEAKERKKAEEHKLNESFKALRLKEKAIAEREREIAKREQGLDQTPEDWLKLAAQFEQYGDFDKAQQARAEAAKLTERLKQHKTTSQFEQAWKSNESEIYEQDPDIFKEGTETQKRLSELFSDPELGPRYRAHPDGIWAAYHRVRLEQAMVLIPQLVQLCQHLKDENDKYSKAQSPITSSPKKGGLGSKSFDQMSDEELEKSILQEVEAIDSGRR